MSNSRGVCILFNNNFEFKIHGEKKDRGGNLLALDLSIEDNRVTLINIYGPNSDNPQFNESIRYIFLEFDNEYYILCGDFNLALNPLQDTHNYCGINNPKARCKVLEVMEDLQLLDYYRVLHPDKKAYTWRKKNPLKQGRLDYFLISNSLSNLVENCIIKPGYRSDHSIVLLEIKELGSEITANGLPISWKINYRFLLSFVYFLNKHYLTNTRVGYFGRTGCGLVNANCRNLYWF